MITYINPKSRHRRDQQPVIIEGVDGVFLDCHYGVKMVAFSDFRESYEGWLARKRAAKARGKRDGK